MRKVHLLPYRAAIKAGVGSIMASYNSWNGEKLHGQKHLLTDVLKGELDFRGFIVSDWAAIDQINTNDFKYCIERSINAGLDMAMVPNGPGQPNSYVDFITKLTELVNEGRVPLARVDDAVRRILRTKIEMGVFEQKPATPALTAAVVLGTVAGSLAGKRWGDRLRADAIRRMFAALLVVVSAMMVLSAWER